MPTKIKLTKFAIVDNPVHPTADKENYLYGQDDNNGYSVPIDYYIVGYLQDEIKVGHSIRATRINRNGVECLGQFSSSKVTSIDGNIINTLNSKYKIEYLKD